MSGRVELTAMFAPFFSGTVLEEAVADAYALVMNDAAEKLEKRGYHLPGDLLRRMAAAKPVPGQTAGDETGEDPARGRALLDAKTVAEAEATHWRRLGINPDAGDETGDRMPPQRQAAHDATVAFIGTLHPVVRPAEREATIWRAVHTALDAAGVTPAAVPAPDETSEAPQPVLAMAQKLVDGWKKASEDHANFAQSKSMTAELAAKQEGRSLQLLDCADELADVLKGEDPDDWEYGIGMDVIDRGERNADGT